MSLILARRQRTNLHLNAAAVVLSVAAVSTVSALDPSGAVMRLLMVVMAFGAALLLSWRLLVPTIALIWLAPTVARGIIESGPLLSVNAVLDLVGLAGIVLFTTLARRALLDLEEENILLGTANGDIAGINPQTGIFIANQLRPSLQAELARSRRFHRSFALILADIDEMRQKFDYRGDDVWKGSLDATTRLLRQTRHNVDRVYHYKDGGFAMILPEAGEKDIVGLVKRLRRLGRSMKPPLGEPGGPLPVHFGATFFPDCATTVDDLLLRAEVALRLAADTTTRYHLDSAEAPALPPPETLRRAGEAKTGGNGSPATQPAAGEVPSGTGSVETLQPGAVPVALQPVTAEMPSGSTLQLDEIEELTERVNETLGMIRSARGRSA